MAIVTRADHPGEFVLESRQSVDLVTNHIQLAYGNLIGILTRALGMSAKIEEFTDSLNSEAEITCMLDERQAFPVRRFKTALITLRPVCGLHQAHFLIVPYGRDLHPCLL
jgi:hypothetical protein